MVTFDPNARKCPSCRSVLSGVSESTGEFHPNGYGCCGGCGAGYALINGEPHPLSARERELWGKIDADGILRRFHDRHTARMWG